MFRIGQRVKVISHNGYKQFENPDYIPSSAPPIGETHVIDDISEYKNHQVLWFKDVGRGVYDIDVEPSSKLEKVLK